jgi:RND family efflux transporter MFP subunit
VSSAPISSGDEAIVTNAPAASATAALQVISANASYMNALNAADSAAGAVTSAENALASADERLALVEEGPSDSDVATADAAVLTGIAALEAAQARLALVQAGATQLQLDTAAAALESARVSLAAAEARQAEALRGPEQNTIEQARAAVQTAQLTVEAARIRLRNAQIAAPFDGTVAAVNIAAGEFASQAAQEPAIVLLTPDLVLLKISVGETDYANVKMDQGGVVLFDGIPGKPYPFRVTSIGLSPTVTQGVVTYEVRGSLVVLPGNPRPAPGMNGRGQITTDSKPDLLVVPPRAVRRRGAEQVVDVRRDGVVVEQVVTTGITDPNNVEITSGLVEGDTIVVPKLTPGESEGPAARPTLPGGVR